MKFESIHRGKRRWPVILLWLLCVFHPLRAGAAEGEPAGRSALKFIGGMASAVLIHEASHAGVAALTGTRLSWEVGTYNQPIGFTDHAGSDAKGIAIFSAGLLAQVLGSEILLQTDRIDKNDAYVRGMMAWNIVNPILYSLDYWLFRVSNRKNGKGYQGDLQAIEHYSSKETADIFAATLAAFTAYQGYRFLKTQPWAPDWMKGLPALTFAPISSGGLALSCHFDF